MDFTANLVQFWKAFGGQVGAEIIEKSVLTFIKKMIAFLMSL